MQEKYYTECVRHLNLESESVKEKKLYDSVEREIERENVTLNDGSISLNDRVAKCMMTLIISKLHHF